MMLRSKRTIILMILGGLCIPWINAGRMTFTVKVDRICAETEFQCKSRACIPQTSRCDGIRDCIDGTDEAGCDLFLCRQPNWYRCKHNGNCISASFLCDKHDDCPLGDDEENCQNYQVPHVPVQCNKFEFSCTDQTCILGDLVCDGVAHCQDRSDETIGCTGIENKCKGFLCKNRHCMLSHDWVCDGVDDCGDGSDEEKCFAGCTLEHGKFECADKSSCVDLKQLCDGNDDCMDRSDEGGWCNSQECDVLQCTEGCKHTPHGAVCVCKVGFVFKNSSKSCEDVNECERYGICSQGCVNTPGSFRCTCEAMFRLRDDGRTCALNDSSEALLLYTTQNSISALHLNSKNQFHVAQNLSRVISVSYDGNFVYWTDISPQSESIERALEDGSNRELLLTSGLALPEELALDWLTGNIYFSDSGKMMIGVCTNSGQHCTILIQDSLRKPRGIALYPQNGTMYYSDWGDNAMIEIADMDGNNQKVLIDNDIHWPTGLSLDWPNERLYWVDAKLKKIESIKLDGTQRMTVIGDVLKHPFSIAVFNDRIYWSDWDTRSIQSCNKFSGKHRMTLVHDRTTYDINVYHPSVQPINDHPCRENPCSHICLLITNNRYACTCPLGMSLQSDKHSCLETVVRQKLSIGIGNFLVKLDIQAFGRHEISKGAPLQFFISRMAFNSITGELFVADNHQKIILMVNTESQTTRKILTTGIGNITALAFDYLGNNLYWSDSERSTVEIFSIQTMHRSIIKHYIGTEAPVGLTVVPEIGKIFIALRSYPSQCTSIDIEDMTGRGTKKHAIDKNLRGYGTIHFVVDRHLRFVYWNDMGRSTIEFTNYEGDRRHLFRKFLRHPVSIAIVGDGLFWTCRHSRQLHWSDQSNLGATKKINIDKPLFGNLPDEIVLLSSHSLQYYDHPCQRKNNGGCSHICIPTGLNSSECVCPTGLIFSSVKNTTCIEAIDCEFKCTNGECLTSSKRCNGNTDCADGSDEKGCNLEDRSRTVECRFDQFLCLDRSECINQKMRCDERYDCPDQSDESDCEGYDPGKRCHENQLACPNGLCIDVNSLCDGFPDCLDGSDEKNCIRLNNEERIATSCGTQMFRCLSGQCIPRGWECDGMPDCADASDEHVFCVMSSECENGFTRCTLGHCIEDRFVCDGSNDCGDNSDEVNCKMEGDPCVGQDEDSPTKFLCQLSGMCLDITVRCNGTSECPHWEDEADCTNCGTHEFQCKSGECIRKEWQCDQEVDCEDGSDEVHCVNGTARVGKQLHAVCRDDSFECKPGVCIDMSKVCDGRNDCVDGKDEKNGCVYACSKNHCEQKCIKRPSGAVCECRRGYTLADNKKSCLDVDECMMGRPCSQACTNIRGSYRCSCYPGFMLRTDKVSCKAVGPSHYILYTSYNQIRKMEGSSIRILIQTNESRITSMDVDVRRQRLYFTDEYSLAIYEYDLVKNSTRVLNNVGHPDQLVVEWITGNLYFYDRSESSIKMCSPERQVCARVIAFPVKFFIKTLAVDPINRILFFSLMHSWIFEVPHTLIYRANLDGSHQQIVSKDISHVTSIQCDTENKVIYVSDLSTKSIKMVDYEGKLVRTVVEKQNLAVSQPIDLTLYENQALVLNMASSAVGRCKLYGNYECKSFELNVHNSNQRDPHTINCSLICVPTEFSGKCICHNGEPIRDGEACPQSTVRNFSSLSESYQRFPRKFLDYPTTQQQSYTVSTSTIKAVKIFLVLIVLTLAMVALVLLCMRLFHRRFNIEMRLYNPAIGVTATAKTNVFQNVSELCQKGSTEEPSSLNETIVALRKFRITADAIELQTMLEADPMKNAFNCEEDLRQR